MMKNESGMKKLARVLFAAAILLLGVMLMSAATAETQYRTLRQGDSGDDVYALKERMYYLGYFNTLNMNSTYTETTTERVKQLQKANGLPETGIATPELQEFIFSDECKWKGTTPVPTAVPTPSPTPVPTPTPPPLTEKGFLDTEAAGKTEYIMIDEELGLWRYISGSLSIEITRHEEKRPNTRWYECDIYASPETPLMTALSQGKSTVGLNRVAPAQLVSENHCVLAISDDYYAHRYANNETMGIIVRNGMIINDTTYKANRPHFPNLEVLAVYDDGSMKTFLSDAYKAQEYLDAGATNVFAFGPVMIQNGELTANMLNKDYYHYKEPRMAIGMIEPYHYLIVTADGRQDDESILGVYMDWMAELMLERGCVEALNLDGGGTACLMFMGKRLNRTGGSIRSLSSMIYFGTSDKVN